MNRRSAWLALAVCAAMLSSSGAISATTGDKPTSEGACTILRIQPLGVLANCRTRLRALWLKFEDMSRVARFTSDGSFHFRCALDVMCVNAVQIDGWMISKEDWQESKQDADAIVELLRKPPAVRQPGAPGPAVPIAVGAKSDCGTFSIQLAGMEGRAACYDSGDAAGSTIAVVVAGTELGFAILFRRSSGDSRDLREEVVSLASRFRLEQSEGDVELLKWMRYFPGQSSHGVHNLRTSALTADLYGPKDRPERSDVETSQMPMIRLRKTGGAILAILISSTPLSHSIKSGVAYER